MAERVEDIRLRLESDKAAAAQAKADIASIRQSIKTLDAGVEGSAASAAKLGAELNKIERAKAINKIAEDAKKARNSTKDWAAELDKVANKLAKIGASDSEIAGVAGAIDQGGGRRQISSRLAGIGREVRALPAIGIPGAGVTTDAIGKVTAALAGLPPVAAPVLLALAGVGAAFVALETSTADAKKSLDAATAANKAYYELIAKGAGSDEAKKRVDELNRTLQAQREELAGIDNAYKNSVGSSGALLGTLARLSSADDKLTERADELRASIVSNEAEMSRLNGALQEGAFSEADYRKQIEETNKARAAGLIATADQTIDEFLRIFKEGALSPSQISERISAITLETSATQRAMDVLKASGDTSKEVTDKILEYELQLGKLGAEQTRLNNLMPTAIARERALADAREKAAQRADTIKAVEKYNQDLVKLEDQYGKDRANAADKYLDAVTKASEAAADAAAEALQKLQDKRADLALDLARDEEDAAIKAQQDKLDKQIEFQQEESDDYADHQAALKKILKDGQRAQEQAIQDRDAVALFNAKESTKDQLDEENAQFTKERDKRNKAYRQQLQDLDRAQQRDREQRLRKYQRDLQDAAAVYNRELQLSQQKYNRDLQLAQQAYQADLQLAQQKYTNELQLRKNAIQAEIALVQQGTAAKLALEQQYWIQSQALMGNNVYPQPTPQPGSPGFNWSQPPSYLTNSGGSTSPFTRTTSSTSMTFSPTINANNRRAIQSEVTTQLNTFLNQAGIP